MNDLPHKIYLQVGDESDENRTWSEHRINDDDIAYIPEESATAPPRGITLLSQSIECELAKIGAKENCKVIICCEEPPGPTSADLHELAFENAMPLKLHITERHDTYVDEKVHSPIFQPKRKKFKPSSRNRRK